MRRTTISAIQYSKLEPHVSPHLSSSCESPALLLSRVCVDKLGCRIIHSLECKHFTKGMFQIDLKDNRVLLWCAVILILGTVSSVFDPSVESRALLMPESAVPGRLYPCNQ